MAMDNDSADEVLAQLKKLREGPGLQRDRLASSGSVMSSLGTSDPVEAFRQLVAVIEDLDEQQTAVLKVDFGLDLDHHLERPPTPREERWLGTRRSGYGLVIGRDPKTLARWSDEALGELRSRLLNDSYGGDLYLVVAVDGDRISHVAMIQEAEAPTDQEGSDPQGVTPVERRTLEFRNPSDGSSPSLFLYAFPRDWQPKNLVLAVTFQSEPLPERVWGFHAPTFIEASFAAERHELVIRDGTATCRFPEPPRGMVYGVWWTRVGTSVDGRR